MKPQPDTALMEAARRDAEQYGVASLEWRDGAWQRTKDLDTILLLKVDGVVRQFDLVLHYTVKPEYAAKSEEGR